MKKGSRYGNAGRVEEEVDTVTMRNCGPAENYASFYFAELGRSDNWELR